MNKEEFRKQGRRNKQIGADFEKRVRKHYIDSGIAICKWSNNIKEGKLVPSRPGRFRMMQTGFPDFFTYNRFSCDGVCFVECKVKGYLSSEEKTKAQWYLNNGFCKKFFIAYKTKEKNRVKINFKEQVKELNNQEKSSKVEKLDEMPDYETTNEVE